VDESEWKWLKWMKCRYMDEECLKMDEWDPHCIKWFWYTLLVVNLSDTYFKEIINFR
jgi:hypothetical protein